MTESAVDSDSPPPPVRLRQDWGRRLLNELFALFIALLLVFAGLLILLDSAPGHRWIIDRIAGLETASGLKIRIGRIDGSIFGKSQLRNVTVSDGQGVFLVSPNIKLDWAPAAWLNNRLSIDSLTAERVALIRAPKLKPSTKKGPILPGFDIRIGELRIDRLDIGPQVGGKSRSGSLHGKADIRSGRALVELQALIRGGGDRIALRLDAEPDRNKFDVGARVIAPADGLVPALIGTKRSINLSVGGNGSWTRWRGAAALDMSGRPTARLALGVDQGRYRLQGTWAPAQFLTGKLQRLTVPRVAIRGDATLKGRQLDGRLTAATPELRAVAKGRLDLASNAYRGMQVGVDLLKPTALFPNMTGKSVRMVGTLDGPFATAVYSYRLTSDFVQFDDTGFTALRAEGRGKLSPWPMRVPLRLSARAITGIGDVAGAMLANPQIEGWLSVTPKLVQAPDLRLTSAKWNGKWSLLLDLVSGRFQVTLSGALQRYLIPGLGIVDVTTDLRVEPGPGGKGTHVVGTGKVWVRRLDNSFFRDLTGGLPSLTTNLERGADGIVHFTNLQLYSPKLRLSGAGERLKDGTFHIVASGRQAKYGPLKLVLDGHIERPKVDLLLARPNEAMGITNMRLLLDPMATGYNYRASGGSRLGPFTSDGQILLPQGAPTTIAIAALDAGGAHATGSLTSLPGGFRGRLALANGSLVGTLDFAPAGTAQRIDAHLTANGAMFQDAFSVRSGRADGTIILADNRTTVDGTIDGRGISFGAVTLARLTANAKLVNGVGQVRAAFAGRRGAAFAFSTLANIEPDRIQLTGNGRIERQPLVLNQPAVLTRSGDGWALAPTSVSFAGGNATVSGRSGSAPEVHAQLGGMPLQMLDLFWPNLDLSGSATGRVDYAWKSNRSGSLNLKIRGLSRAGLVLASKPIDVGIAAVMNGGQAGVRAVAASDGAVVGRAQAKFAPLGNGPLVAELMNAPLFAQLRYTGPADTLWRLTGSEILDMSGPVAIGAEVGGRLADPVIRGALRTSTGRLESQVTGMVIDHLATSARFSGPQLIFNQISGQTSGGGSLSGSGNVTFSGGKTLINLSFNANQALLLNRDDVAARVTGPLAIKSDANGGTISGDLKLNKGRFQLGRASAAAAVPQLNVRETGLDEEDVIEPAQLHPWKLDLKLAGSDLTVTGLGINSRWTTNLQIGGLADQPRFTGRADLVQGNYDFAGRNFRLDRGIIRFRGESPPDPQLDIHAQADVQGLSATVNVQGTGLRPEITFASTPPMPQDELLSRILFGTSITNLSAPEALQLASAVAALQSGSGSLDPINALRRAIGLDRLRIVPADVATGQKTAIAAGKYITRKLFVEVVTDGQGYSATQVEYQVTRWLSLLSTVSTIGRSSASVRVSKDY
ncbi:translocation/assembly module TamB domain-containing protein [Sphingomonas flavescens]|uniref:translocation/assembly module TamB domain-containing protein n=1 Tax=Sphingomonas flavescens TaxID=3132797 RepID=UPI002805C877|nr:translocation/assembly module TamB domain-containing protein [Sphingomonas limnosediminicola]